MNKKGSWINILIADDHAIVREGLKNIISGTSDIVVTDEASNGAEVLSKVLKNDYDMIVLDITMPGRDGIDVLKQIKNFKPDLGPERGPDRRKVARCEGAFGQEGQLKEQRVEGALQIAQPHSPRALPGAHGRAVEDHDALERAHLMRCELQGDHHAPVVSQDDRLFCARCVDERRGIIDQVLDRIAPHPFGLVGLAETAQVRCPGPVAEGGQQRELMAPRVPDLGKAVEAQRQAVAFAARVHR